MYRYSQYNMRYTQPRMQNTAQSACKNPQTNGCASAKNQVQSPVPNCSAKDLNGLPLAMSYVPIQNWETPYEVCAAFSTGTIFPSLDFPFLGGK